MEKLKRGDKIYLDVINSKESDVNSFLDCRDGVVEVYEYNDNSGYGAMVRLFLCQNTKHESVCIIRQTYNTINKEWNEESMYFDTDSFEFLKAIINGKEDERGGTYTLVRDYSEVFNK